MIHQRVASGVRAHNCDMARVREVNSQTLRTIWRSAHPQWGQEGAVLILQTGSSPDSLLPARTESWRKDWQSLQERDEGEGKGIDRNCAS